MGEEATVAARGELALVDAIRQRVGACRGSSRLGVGLGIGDDAAITRFAVDELVLSTTDLLIEDVHFRRRHGTPEELGARALTVNVSDIAAMGGEPRHILLGLAVPGALAYDWVLRLVDGLIAVAREYEMELVGGDCSASPAGLVLSLTVTGAAAAGHVVCRSGAQVGDVLVVSGSLGNSAAGFLLLERGLAGDSAPRKELIESHLRPRAAVAVGRHAAASGAVSAMIDVSDGLAADLRHLLRESGGLGATIDAKQLPIADALRCVCSDLHLDSVGLALAGGEDYRLLMTVAPSKSDAWLGAARRATGSRLSVIGRVESEPGLRLISAGKRRPLAITGYQHWRD